MSVFECVLSPICVCLMCCHILRTYPLESTCAGKSAQHFQVTSLRMSSVCNLRHPSVYVRHYTKALDYTGRLCNSLQPPAPAGAIILQCFDGRRLAHARAGGAKPERRRASLADVSGKQGLWQECACLPAVLSEVFDWMPGLLHNRIQPSTWKLVWSRSVGRNVRGPVQECACLPLYHHLLCLDCIRCGGKLLHLHLHLSCSLLHGIYYGTRNQMHESTAMPVTLTGTGNQGARCIGPGMKPLLWRPSSSRCSALLQSPAHLSLA